MDMVVSKLQYPGSAADRLLHHLISETGAACPFYPPATDNIPILIYFLSISMGRCTTTRRQSLRTTKGYFERRRPRHPALVALEI
jgi:hypothetical protein